MGRKLLLSLLLFSLSISRSHAQGMAGKDFWVGFMDEDFFCTPVNPFDIYKDDTTEVFVSSAYNATVTIRIEAENWPGSGLEQAFTRTFTLTTHKTHRVQFPYRTVVRTFWGDIPVRNGVHVTADSPITVQAINRFWSSRGGTAVIPTESLPNSPEYFVITNHPSNKLDCHISHNPSFSSAFLIVGIAQESKIEILPKGKSTLRFDRSGIPIVISLKKGETFFYPTSDNELTGTVIRSKNKDAKFAVFAGDRLTQSIQPDSSGQTCTGGSDHTFEQMLPTVNWGKKYTALPFKNNLGGYYLKIVAAEEQSRISINGSYVTTLQQGEFYIHNAGRDTPAFVSSDKRISVAQFAKGNGCNQYPAPNIRMGDVAEMILAPDEQTGNTDAEINFVTAYKQWPVKVANKPESYFNILVKTSDTAQFRINGSKVAANQWKTSPALNGKSFAQLKADSGMNHALSNPGGVIAYTYGYGIKEGYAYMASTGFKILNNDFLVDNHCLYDSVFYEAIPNDSFTSYSWDLGDGVTRNGSSAMKIYSDTGWARVAMYFRHKRTNELDSVVKHILIFSADRREVLCGDTIVCGKVDFPLYSKYFNTDKQYLWHDGHPNYYKAIKKPGMIWVKVTDRQGCTYRDTAMVYNYKYPFASFRAWDTSICLNKNRDLLFTNNSTTPDTIVSNTWYFGEDTFVNNSYNFRHKFSKAGTYKLKLVVRSIHGCEDDTIRPLQVSPVTEAGFDITSIDSCLNGNFVTLKNTTVIDSALHKSFRWFFSEGFFLNNSDPSVPWNYATPGKYKIMLIYENKYRCVDTAQKDIRIYEHPKTSFAFSKFYECSNDSVRLNNTTTSVHTPVLSSWSFGDGSKDTVKHAVHLYPSKGVYTLKLVSASPQGCKDSSSVRLRIYEPPKAGFTIDDTFQCLTGNRFGLQDNSSTDSGAISFIEWSHDDTTKDLNRTKLYKSFMYYGKHNIRLKVENTFGCVDSITKEVVVKKDPSAWFDINDFSQCFKDHRFDLSYVPVAGNDAIISTSWYYAGDSAKNVNNIQGITFPAFGKYPLKLRLKDIDGCIGETTRTAFVNPEPVADIRPIPPQCFRSNSFDLFEQSTIPSGGIGSYHWDFGDMSSSGLQHPIDKVYNSSGLYSVRLRVESDSGCSGFDTAMAEVYPNADIQVFPVPDVCLGDSSVFKSNVTVNPGSIVAYRWDFGDMGTSGNKDARHRYSNAGLYNITLATLTDRGCTDTFRGTSRARVHELPKAEFTYKSIDGGNKNTVIMFEGTTQPTPRSWFWDFENHGNSNKKDTSLSITDTVTVRTRLYVTDNNGCTGMTEKYIFIAPPMPVFFPSAFSPNGDGHNDGFGPTGTMYATNYVFRIFNRWGEKLFESDVPGVLWNGAYQDKICPNGMYYFHVEFNDYNGNYKEADGMFLLMR